MKALDELDYYELLGLERGAQADGVRNGFHRFAQLHHPDRHTHSPLDVRMEAQKWFRRGTEAYRILSDPDSRTRYDDGLTRGEVRATMSVRGASLEARASVAPKPVRLEDAVRNPAARPFARRAEELSKTGDRAQAKLQLSLAMNMDPKNEALEAFLRTLENAPVSSVRPPPGSR